MLRIFPTRRAFASRPIKRAICPYELTVSIGHEQASHDASLKDLIEKADAKLYEEKKRLGNVRK